MITKKVFLSFPPTKIGHPIVNHLVKDYNLSVNIFRAKVTPDENGYMVLEVSGEESDFAKAFDFIKTLGIEVNADPNSVQWDPEICVHCGNCIPHCPTDALTIPNRSSMEIRFDEGLCIECLNCIANCPFGALRSAF